MFGIGLTELLLLLFPVLGACLGVRWAGQLGRNRAGWGAFPLSIRLPHGVC